MSAFKLNMYNGDIIKFNIRWRSLLTLCSTKRWV